MTGGPPQPEAASASKPNDAETGEFDDVEKEGGEESDAVEDKLVEEVD